MADVGDFLREAFDWKQDEHYILMWTVADKQSHWFTGVDQAIDFVKSHSEEGVYMGVGLSPKDFGPRQRCPSDKIAAIAAIVLDVDFQHAVHKKSSLLSQEDALKLFTLMPAPPSFIVNSGHGYHGWWMLKEPWAIENDLERSTVARIAEDWNAVGKRIANSMGGTIDSVYDLARVMRVPGTMNVKADPIRAFIEQESNWRAAGLEDFLEALAMAPPVAQEAPRLAEEFVGALDKNPNASPPTVKFAALAANEPKFLGSFEHKRKDLEDDSPSGYDMSLASFAAEANWSAQEICNLLIACRRENGCELKLGHDSYYERTIGLALRADDSTRASREIMRAEPSDDDALANVSRVLGVNIERVIRYWADPPDFVIQIEGMIIRLEHGTLTSQSKLRLVIEERCLRTFPNMKADKWQKIKSILLGAAETYSLGRENTEVGAVKSWVSEYIRTDKLEQSLEDSMSMRYPFKEDGRVYLYLDEFVRWVDARYRHKVSTKWAATALRRCGAEPITKNVYTKDLHTTRHVWMLPFGMVNGDVEE